MNKRESQIIETLGLGEVLTIAQLAERFAVSERTVRKDLDSIDAALRRNGEAGIRLERGGRVICMGDPSVLLGVTRGMYAYQPERSERVRMEAALIVLADEGTTLNTLAESLLVSRNTIINDQDDVKVLLEREGLALESKASKGLRATGAETSKRFLLRDAFYEISDGAARILAELSSLTAASMDMLNKLLDDQQVIHDCILTDESLRAIRAYIYVAFVRLRDGRMLEDEDVALVTAADDDLMALSSDFFDLVEDYFNLPSNEAERRFFGQRLEHRQFARHASERRDIPKVQTMTRQLIERLSVELGIDLVGDFTFFENLSNHLASVLRPDPVDYPDTPLIRQVMQENKAIMAAVRACDDLVCSYVGRDLTELEVGYIALHVGAAIERKKSRQMPLHAVVVCNSGVGTSQLLTERLRGNFNFKIVRTCTARELDTMGPADVDLVITTVPLKVCPVDWVLVSPLLSDEDAHRIALKVSTLRTERNLDDFVPGQSLGGSSAKGLSEQLAPVVYDLAPDRAPALMRAINRVIAWYFGEPNTASPARADQASVANLLPASHIRLDVHVSDWREAVRESARVLLRGGYIESRYIDAMIANIEENGPYVVLTPGFAMPHEGVGTGSLEMGLSLIRLDHPIEFGEPDNDPVEFVCCLSAVDHDSHLHAFFNLVALMRDPHFRSELHQAWTSEQAAAIIERWELALPA